jgi:hypothetical protein
MRRPCASSVARRPPRREGASLGEGVAIPHAVSSRICRKRVVALAVTRSTRGPSPPSTVVGRTCSSSSLAPPGNPRGHLRHPRPPGPPGPEPNPAGGAPWGGHPRGGAGPRAGGRRAPRGGQGRAVAADHAMVVISIGGEKAGGRPAGGAPGPPARGRVRASKRRACARRPPARSPSSRASGTSSAIPGGDGSSSWRCWPTTSTGSWRWSSASAGTTAPPMRTWRPCPSTEPGARSSPRPPSRRGTDMGPVGAATVRG